MKRNLWQTIKNSCVIFTLIILLFYVLGVALFPKMIPSLTTIGVFFLFSIALAFINEIFFAPKLSLVVKCVIHFFATLALILISFAVTGKFAQSGAVIIILSFIYAIMYWIGAAIALIVNGKGKKKKNTEKKYEKMFK